MDARIDFVFFDAGGGHRAAATALESVITVQQRHWRIRLLNLQEVLDETDLVRKFTGLRTQDTYNRLLERGWTLGSAQLLKLLHLGIRVLRRSQVGALARFWGDEPPDMVVSLVPNFNRTLYDAFASVKPGASFVTVLTDLADYPPHFWIERQDQWVICGTGRAEQQARAMGIPETKVLRASGMILRPHFYEPAEVDRQSERRRLGLEPDRPTGLVMFGGYGSPAMMGIAKGLQRTQRDLQLICICGRNDTLARQLRALPSRFPLLVEGFTQEIPYYMKLADFFIGKPGPGSISEAIAMNLPVIVQRDWRTLPQERYNADWVIEHGVGMVVSRYRQVPAAVERLIEPGVIERHRKAVAAIENRAVFEIPGMLEEILAAGSSHAV